MEVAIFVILVLLTLALLAYGTYLLVRIAGIWKKLRVLNAQRDYEILLSAALPQASVEELLQLIPEGYSRRHLAGALERMTRVAEGESLRKLLELRERLGLPVSNRDPSEGRRRARRQGS